jgi:hypothetical protein
LIRLPRHPLVTSVALGEPYDVYVGRDSRIGDPEWGNWPARWAGRRLSNAEAVAAYEAWLSDHPEWAARMRRELAGKTLCCHCAKRGWTPPCHAVIIATVSNSAPAWRQPTRKTLLCSTSG